MLDHISSTCDFYLSDIFYIDTFVSVFSYLQRAM